MEKKAHYAYGTSGFRFHHTVIEKIAKKIGQAVGLLSAYAHQPYGIMITASHNPHEDNGVKIMNYKGEMIHESEEKTITEYINSDHHSKFDINMIYPRVFIGYDTRASSPKIFDLIKTGVKEFHHMGRVDELPCVTTPEMHYLIHASSNGINMDYTTKLLYLLDKVPTSFSIICDCANGVGAVVLKEINRKVERIQLINTDIKNHSLLNESCGSDFVVNTKEIPSEDKSLHNLYASLDGDADRVVFYYQDYDNFHLLNGDKISALIAFYISLKIPPENISVIHTGYSNGAFIEFIHSLGIKTVCTATGVKNLHAEALKHNVSIYFESNGHGTVLFNQHYPELSQLEEFFHPTIGDGIMDMLAIMFILQDLKMPIDDWKDLYMDYPYALFKMEVSDKNTYQTTQDELRLIEPMELQNKIDTLSQQVCESRAFVRPSGTENYIRIYVESNTEDKVDFLCRELKQYIMKSDDKSFEKNGRIFIVKDLSKQDYSIEYFKLLQQLTSIDPEAMDQEQFDEFVERLNNHHKIKVIRDKESRKIVGSITILIEEKLIHNFGKVAHVEDVVVDESMRGYGLGKKLLEIAEEESTGCYKIILDCSDENRPFYEKCGYKWKGNEMAKYL